MSRDPMSRDLSFRQLIFRLTRHSSIGQTSAILRSSCFLRNPANRPKSMNQKPSQLLCMQLPCSSVHCCSWVGQAGYYGGPLVVRWAQCQFVTGLCPLGAASVGHVPRTWRPERTHARACIRGMHAMPAWHACTDGTGATLARSRARSAVRPAPSSNLAAHPPCCSWSAQPSPCVGMPVPLSLARL